MHPKTHFSTKCSSLTFSYTTPLCLTLSLENIVILCVITENKIFPY